MKTSLLLLVIILLLTSTGSCHNGATDSIPTAEEQMQIQIRGIGIKNRGNDSVIVYEQNNKKQLLYPGESCDYSILNSPSILMIVGQNDQWEVESQKRYQLVIDSTGSWVIEEVP